MLTLTSKAETLAALRPVVRNAVVLPQIHFSVKQWRRHRGITIERLHECDWQYEPLIVRSSSRSEDTTTMSNAGRFLSILNVLGDEQLENAIDRVIASYGDAHDDDQVLVQPMLQEVRVSGVLFTRDPTTGSFYYVINYDDRSGTTDSVTGGRSGALSTRYLDKTAVPRLDGWICNVIDLAQELEVLLQQDALDIEFAVTQAGILYLTQVRPLALNVAHCIEFDQQRASLARIEEKVASQSTPHPYLLGQRTVYGIMPDWNPAEIIGVRPRPLTLSLYKELVTDQIWAYQRSNYGYRDVRSFPLLISFYGLPYIDVRVSFNSFVPKDVPDDLANRLVDYYLDTLCKKPSFHDKVEFEIIYSCYTLDLNERVNPLLRANFSEDDIATLKHSLLRLTNLVIRPDGLWRSDIDRIHELVLRQQRILSSSLSSIEKIYWLIEDCKRYGTLPFAGLARAAFIAVQLLRSFVATNILTERDYEQFMRSLKSVSSTMAADFDNVEKQDFLKKYGHLRPGTYDIRSHRYDETPDRYFDWRNKPGAEMPERPFRMSILQLNKLETLLQQHGIAQSALGLLNFITAAIEGREYAKFVFTRSLSDSLSLLGHYGTTLGFDRDALSYVDYDTLRTLYQSACCETETLNDAVLRGRRNHCVTNQLSLPPLIRDQRDVRDFSLLDDEPNFVTLGRAEGKVITDCCDIDRLPGNILMIPNADPGYDWIFSRRIAGFVTKFGGVNSHMAIRAGELGIPAIIGSGERYFQQWSRASLLQMDCANKQVTVLR